MSAAHHPSSVPALPFESAGLRISSNADLARCGAKGSGTRAWLEATGYGPVPAPNRAVRLINDGLLVMLGENDALVLRTSPWGFGDGDALASMVYPVPRREGTTWFELAGARATDVLACVCGVDLRAKIFRDLDVAQTIVARVSAIIIREDRNAQPSYHVLSDISYGGYLATQLIDAARSLAALDEQF